MMFDLIILGPLLVVATLAIAMCFGRFPRPQTLLGWLIAFSATAVSVAWPFASGVWLPDIFGSPRTLAEVTGPSGATYQVVQYWNHIDFYTTELRIALPNTATRVVVLDGDDNKSWSVPLSVDETAGSATVTLSGDRKKTVNLHDGTSFYHDQA